MKRNTDFLCENRRNLRNLRSCFRPSPVSRFPLLLVDDSPTSGYTISTRSPAINCRLLRAGERTLLEPLAPDTPYCISLSRADDRPYISVWPIPLNSRLPTIPVPLAAGDPDAVLPLGQIVASVYERGGYDAQIDYRKPVPPPPLTDEEAAWVSVLLNPNSNES